MHETDIARTRRQVERVAEQAQDIVDEVETVSDAGFDPAQSQTIQQKQKVLIEELGQALADFNELVNRAETVETGSVEYEVSGSDIDLTHNETDDVVSIDYSGSVDLDPANVTVEVGGSVVDVFSSTITAGTTETVDVSGLSDGDEVVVSVETERVIPKQHQIKSWADLIGSDNAPEVSVSNIQMPNHDLIEPIRTVESRLVIGQSQTL